MYQQAVNSAVVRANGGDCVSRQMIIKTRLIDFGKEA